MSTADSQVGRPNPPQTDDAGTMAQDPRALLQQVRFVSHFWHASRSRASVALTGSLGGGKQADKTLASASGGFSFFSGREDKYQNAADLYIQAANAFRMQQSRGWTPSLRPAPGRNNAERGVVVQTARPARRSRRLRACRRAS